jgi:hypothetical protein
MTANLRMSAGGVTLQAAFAEDGDWDDREAMAIVDPTRHCP